MKIIRHGGGILLVIIEHRGEKAFLSRMRALQQAWVPLLLKSSTTPFAKMQVWTYQVRLFGDHRVKTAQQALGDREEGSVSG